MNIPIRWSDNTQELSRHLAEGLNQIEATHAAAEKMAKALSGDNLIRAAHNYTAAIEKLGGVEKLTSGEKARINDLLDKAIQKYTALGQTAPAAMQELFKATTKVVAPINELEVLAGKFAQQLGSSATQAAQAYVVAVEKMGGANKLTATEQARVNSVVAEAVQKYQALGQQAPAAMVALEQATRKTIQPIDQLADETQRLVDQFGGSKLGQVNAYVAAVEKIGGASKLTASEQRNVNQVVTEAIDKYRVLGQQAPDGMLKLAEATKQVEPPTEGLGARITGLVAAAAAAKVAIGGLIHLGREWVTASNEQEDATVRLETALRAQGTFTPVLAKQYEELAQAFQQTTVFGAALIQEMEALLVQIGGVMPQDMKAALTASTDLAAGLRIDLQSATMLVAKALEGNVGSLKRYGIAIDESKMKTEGASAVFDAIAEKMGGQAAAQAKTFSGEMARVGNVVNDVQEQLGSLIARALSPAIDMFMALPGPIRTATVALGLLGAGAAVTATAVAGLSAALALALPMFGLSAATAGAAAMTSLGVAVAGTTALMGPLAIAIAAVWAAWKIGQTETVKNTIAEWGLSSENLTARLYRLIAGLDKMTPAQARAAIAATVAAEQAAASARAHDQAAGSVRRHADAMGDFVGPVMSAETEMRIFQQHLSDQEKAHKEAEAAAKKHAAALEAWRQSVTDATVAANLSVFTLNKLGATALPNVSSAMGDVIREVRISIPLLDGVGVGSENAARSVEDLQRQGEFLAAALVKVNAGMATLPNVSSQMVGAIDQVRNAVKTGGGLGAALLGDLQQLPNLMVSALTGGGGLRGAVAGAGSMIGSTFGSAIGKGVAMLGKFGGPIGAALGSLAGPLLEKLFSIGGPSKKELEGRDASKDFQQDIERALTAQQRTEASGRSWAMTVIGVRDAYVKTGRSAAEAEAAVARLWAAEKQGPEAVARVQAEIQTVFDEVAKREQDVANGVDDIVSAWNSAGTYIPAAQRAAIEGLLRMNGLTDEQREKLQGLLDASQPNFQQLADRAKAVGIEVSALGPAFTKGRLGEETKKVVDLINELREAGGDTGTILAGTKDEISQLVQEAMKAGVALPDSLKEYVQNLADTGGLLDENGQQIKDLSGIKFEGTPLDRGLDKLNKAIEKFAETLDRINGKKITTEVETRYTYAGEREAPSTGDPGFTDPDVTQQLPDPLPMARGGAFRVSRPTLFLAGEAGPEYAIFGGANKSLESGGGQRVTSVGDIIIQMPPGTTLENPEAFALGFQRALRFNVLGTLTGLENTIDKRVALAAGAVG